MKHFLFTRRPSITGRSRRPGPRRRRASLCVLGLLAPVFAISVAQPAQAATPVIKTGDIITASQGNIFDGDTIDKFDPVTGVRTRVAAGFDRVRR